MIKLPSLKSIDNGKGDQSNPLVLSPRSLIISLIFGLMLWNINPGLWIDRVWSDLLLSEQKLKPSADIVLIRIRPEDTEAMGHTSSLRLTMAEALKRLKEARAERVLIDMTFLTRSSPEADKALSEAIAQWPKGRIATSTNGEVIDGLAPPDFLKQTVMLEGRYLIDNDGRVRALNYHYYNRPHTAFWAAGRPDAYKGLFIDQRLDPKGLVQFRLGDLLARRVPVSALEGKIILIGNDYNNMAARLNLPGHGVSDRTSLMALGVATIKAGNENRHSLSEIVAILMAITLFILGHVQGFWIASLKDSFRLSLVVNIIVIGICLGLSLFLGLKTYPIKIMLGFMLGLNLAISYRLQLVSLLGNLLKGDLSPEEALAWHKHEARDRPVILFGDGGRIKRANEAAKHVFGLKDNADNLALMGLCYPSVGVRSKVIKWPRLQKADDRNHGLAAEELYGLEWPHAYLSLVVFADQTAQYQKEQELRTKALMDPLTGLGNRASFDETLNGLNGDYTIYFMDMNGFKGINDTYGHEAGDLLLSITAKRLLREIRSQDVLCRLGGDEFALIAKGRLNQDRAAEIAGQLEGALKSPVDLNGVMVSVGLAVGFASAVPDKSAAQTLKEADMAMYQRKATLKKAA
jgi:diguanylate cyclase (GGDEF)-like protein